MNRGGGIVMHFQIREIQLRIVYMDFANVMFLILNK